jgi:hypothetical protein
MGIGLKATTSHSGISRAAANRAWQLYRKSSMSALETK